MPKLSNPNIFSTHPLHPDATRMLEAAGRLYRSKSLDPADLISAGREADLIIVRTNLPPALFDDCPRLRAAIRHGAGLDMVPMPEATRAGVLVANVPGANARTVAEHALMVSMMLARHHRMIDAKVRSNIWQPARDIAETSAEIYGRTIGIIGFGAIGAALAAMAQGGFGMRVLAHRRSDAALPDRVERQPLDELIAEADIVVLACPLTHETRGLINAARLRRMKRSAFLINVARGPVIVEADLIGALKDGAIAGAALDVFEKQPLPEDHIFRQMENVVLTPHIAGITEESMRRIALSAAEQALQVIAGELPRHLVNPEALLEYRRRFG